MGTYFNPDNESFRRAIKSKIYIDKTGLLNELNQRIGSEDNCISLSHARRFGKSQAASMIESYYSAGCDSASLFSGYKISEAEDYMEHLNRYNVIHLDISSFADRYKETLVDNIWRILYAELKEAFPDIMEADNPIGTILMQVYKKSGRAFVIIIDEWDCVIRNHADRQDLVHIYLQFLHSLFKSHEANRFLALGYITGILPIKKINDESALNNFREYTMIKSKSFTEYFGFTEEEVKKLCLTYDMDFESVKAWYNGYYISGKHMYNPNSVYQSMVEKEYDSYWKNTSSFSTINDFITLNMDGLKEDVLSMLAGGKVSVDVDGFKNDLSCIQTKDDALTALIHLGYLGYDAMDACAYVPNYEVLKAYQAALKESGWNEVAKTIARCDELLNASIRKDADKVAEIIEMAHDAYISHLKYNDENSLSCVITLAYFTAPAYYEIYRELPSGKGYADYAFIPRKNAGNRPAMIIELKYDKTVDSAIGQIKDRRYDGKLKGYSDEIILIGINYDKKDANKKHSCVIETVQNGAW